MPVGYGRGGFLMGEGVLGELFIYIANDSLPVLCGEAKLEAKRAVPVEHRLCVSRRGRSRCIVSFPVKPLVSSPRSICRISLPFFHPPPLQGRLTRDIIRSTPGRPSAINERVI